MCIEGLDDEKHLLLALNVSTDTSDLTYLMSCIVDRQKCELSSSKLGEISGCLTFDDVRCPVSLRLVAHGPNPTLRPESCTNRI